MEQRWGVSGASTTKQARNRGGSEARWKAKRRDGRCVFAFAWGGNDDRGGGEEAQQQHSTTAGVLREGGDDVRTGSRGC